MLECWKDPKSLFILISHLLNCSAFFLKLEENFVVHKSSLFQVNHYFLNSFFFHSKGAFYPKMKIKFPKEMRKVYNFFFLTLNLFKKIWIFSLNWNVAEKATTFWYKFRMFLRESFSSNLLFYQPSNFPCQNDGKLFLTQL
jgi:hypothetical protein